MGKITKADIIDAIYNKTGLERRDIGRFIDLFFEELKSALVSNNVIEFRGFGTFEIKIRKGREKARNPKTGELFPVEPHGVVAFRAGRKLRQDVWDIGRNNGQTANNGEGT